MNRKTFIKRLFAGVVAIPAAIVGVKAVKEDSGLPRKTGHLEKVINPDNTYLFYESDITGVMDFTQYPEGGRFIMTPSPDDGIERLEIIES